MVKENMFEKANKLINEKSPYLLQHAHNPVDWYPWCEEAFKKAQAEDKPIFLSIGYSTCHWCHVMAHESFEDEEVAKILNENFVSIKVDREERPDIDSIYMTFCQMFTGSGGWPLSVFMTPEKKPFFAGTYFPKEDRYGMRGIVSLLKGIVDAWRKDKGNLIEKSHYITGRMQEAIKDEVEEVGENLINKAYTELREGFDKKYGGFGLYPKFPIAQNLMFLLRYYDHHKDEKALYMVEETLKHMFKGGIFDHIGYGFSRYSTDEKWLVPHFEKMLYDNALLAIAYIETYEVTKKEFYREVCEKIIDYVIRDMMSSEGAFYCAEDADSEGVEGKFYVWGKDEIKDVLKDNWEIYCKYYDITDKGNFEGKNIPNLINADISDLEKDKEVREILYKCRKKLFQHREKRIHPHKDDKILTSWNGLMIAAIAHVGRVLNNENYISYGENAVNFILHNMINEKGRLMARYKDGQVDFLAYLDDYAFIIWSLIELYNATFKDEYLKEAVKLNDEMLRLFWDDENGGFFLYGEDGENLIVRPKEIYDGAIPSGNSVAALNMIRLARITGNVELENKVNQMFKCFGGKVNSNPSLYNFFNMALMYAKEGGKEIVICGHKEDKEVKDILCEINKRFLPFTSTIVYDGNEDIVKIIPYIKDYSKIDNKTTIYVCQNNSCSRGINSLEEFVKKEFS
ncbi:thioredoxin domain-containing protein [Haloimpatiens massiliensis]|uniref:thioredoxin domain-containing protein n=1 Tax=Haloimpatiens massiliensis TaxID=1658110 RepID=UPI000C85513D|nr:thioredoxin domain-containing protein [Haloimpatiens massiliensis]